MDERARAALPLVGAGNVSQLPAMDEANSRSGQSGQPRVRSYNSIGYLAHNSRPVSPPSSTEPGSPLCTSSEPSSRESQPADGIVHVRMLNRAGQHRGAHAAHDKHVGRSRWLHWLCGPLRGARRICAHGLEREAFILIVLGLFLGVVLHGAVLWSGLHARGVQYAAQAQAKDDQKGVAAGDATHPAPKRPARGSPEALGMPGDSDRLANNPVWDASKWSGPPRIHPGERVWPNSVAICSIMKEENPDDVAEWLQYHRWIGVDKVFLRENGDLSAALQQRLQSFVDDGFLDLGTLPGPKHPLQNRWYNRCSKPDMAGLHSWIAFIDLDEFIVVLDRGVAAKDPSLKDVLRSFKGNAGLSLQWVLFGSSGHTSRPHPGGPLAHFDRCTGHLSYQMKCMANMYYATHHMMVGNTVHDCTYRLESEAQLEEPPVTTSDGTRLRLFQNTGMTNPERKPELGLSRTYIGHLNSTSYDAAVKPDHRLALFHYVTRSLEDYSSRKVGLPSGLYTHNYVSQSKRSHSDVSDVEVMAKFEADNGFDGDDLICRSAKSADYAARIWQS